MSLLPRRHPNVEKLARKGKVERLVGALSYEDAIVDRQGVAVDLGTEVRRAATEALAAMDSPEAFDGLLRALGDPQPIVRLTAVRGIHGSKNPRAAERLSQVVVDWSRPEDARAREEALRALESLRDPSAPRLVAAGLVTRTADLDEAADAELLRRLAFGGERAALAATVDDLVTRLRERVAPERVRSLLVWLAPASVDPLIAALADDGSRHDAILALGAAHDSRAVEPLCEVMLGGYPVRERAAAASALGEIRDPGAVESLLIATGDTEYDVRSAAGDSFDKLGNAGIALAMSALVRPALANGSAPVREAMPAPADVRGRPAAAPRLPQAAPALRRLLGRRASP